MADGDLISRASLLAGIAELKESPWYNYGKYEGDFDDLTVSSMIDMIKYSERKEAIAVIIEQCIEKETAVEAEQYKNPEKGRKESEQYCYDCIHNEVCSWHPHDGCDFKETVKHGRWIESDTQRHVEVTYECSECQHEVVGEYEKTPFCGGCGTKMDVIYQDDKIKAVKVVGWEGDSDGR